MICPFQDKCTLWQLCLMAGHCHCVLPLFPSQYGNLTFSEDTAVGSTILTIQATDADEPFTGSSKILYRITQGDKEGRLAIDTDPHTNAGYVTIKKVNSPLNELVFLVY